VKARIAASVVLAAALMLGTAGCSFFAPQATLKHYDPSDGVGTTVGDIKVRNALLVTGENEDESSLLINLVNVGDKGVTLLVQFEGEDGKSDSTVRVPAGDVVSFGAEGEEQFVLSGISAKPGDLLPIWFQYGDETGKQLLVPVLDNSLLEYSELTPSPTPTETPTPSVSPSPSSVPAA
jgi:hypothetical protein